MDTNLNGELLKAFFEASSNEVHILEAVRDSDKVIKDFRYLMGSKVAYGGQVDLTGKLLLTVYPWKKETGLFDHFVNVTENDEPLNLVFQYNQNGHKKWYNIQAKKFNNGLIVYREDITMAKQAEEKIMELNRVLFSKNRELETLSSELTTFTTIAANDYNETLKNVYNSMEFLVNNDAKNLSDAGKANIRRAQAAVQKMKLLTEDIVEFSKIHSTEERTSVDLNEILTSVLNTLDQKIKSENAVILYDKLPVIMGYPSLLSLLFSHLITNAIKFRKPDIAPTIEIRHFGSPGANIKHSASICDVDYNVVSFQDNGIGFDPHEGEKIFTMFYRRNGKGRPKGSGIGLAICKKIMDLHGGFIASDCAPECTTFNCCFPNQEL
jgi:light-regulated signal transduction histidine kinase (bacteriophytochrome)